MNLLPRPMKRFPLTKGLDPDKMMSYTFQKRLFNLDRQIRVSWYAENL